MHILVFTIDEAIAAPLREKLPEIRNITFEWIEDEKDLNDPVKDFSRPKDTVLLALGEPSEIANRAEIFDKFAGVAVIDPYDVNRATRLLGAGLQDVLAAKGCTVNLLFRTLQHALTRHARLKMALRLVTRREVSSMLNRLPMAVIILNRDKRVLANNTRAHRLFNESGLFARDDSGLLHINNRQLAEQIETQLAQMGGPGAEKKAPEAKAPEFLAEQIEDSDGALYVLGVPAGNRESRQALTLFIYNAGADMRISDALLRKFYGLTKAEAKLASRLATGLSLEDVVEETGRSIQTLRSQLKNIFSKMGVTRQAELIKSILTGPAVLAAEAHSLPASENDNQPLPELDETDFENALAEP